MLVSVRSTTPARHRGLARREDHDRWAALEPVHQGMRHAYGAFGKDVARGLALRSDLPQYAADAFRNELTWLGITYTPSFVGEPQCNGVIESLHPDPEGTVSLAPSLRDPGRGAGDHRAFIRRYNEEWIIERLDYRTGHRPTGASGGGLTKATACPKNRALQIFGLDYHDPARTASPKGGTNWRVLQSG